MKRGLTSYMYALAATSPVLPSVIAIACLFAAIASTVSFPLLWGHVEFNNPLAIGLALSLAVWLVLGLGYIGFLSPESANQTSYFDLKLRLKRVEAILCGLTDSTDDACKANKKEVCKQVGMVHCELARRGLRWAAAIGYINAWQGVHAAEEALIRIEPRKLVLEDAQLDELRLTGSRINNQDVLLNLLKTACIELKESSVASEQEQAARGTIRNVRHALNTFRDSSFSGIVRARNRIISAMAATGIVTDLLIALAVIQGAPQTAIIAAGEFFLVGALVACFSMLNVLSQASTSVEDYGLGNARLLMRPLFSGLAGVCGVVLVAMLSPVVTTTVSGAQSTVPATATPAASATPTRSSTPGVGGRLGGGGPTSAPPTVATPGVTSAPATINTVNTPDLSQIFDVRTHPFSILIAAVFGLTPTLLLDRLLQQTDQYKANLKSSEPSEHGSVPKPMS